MSTVNVLSHLHPPTKAFATASSSFANKSKKFKHKHNESRKQFIAFEKKRGERFQHYFDLFKQNIKDDLHELDSISKEFFYFEEEEYHDQNVDIDDHEKNILNTKDKHDIFFEEF